LFVKILEDKLCNLYQILPRPDPRRGLLNTGGNILKTIFGTASESDVHELHGVLDDLQNRNSDIVHSLAKQLTYVKKVADTTSLNTESIANFSNIVKDSIIHSSINISKLHEIYFGLILQFWDKTLHTQLPERWNLLCCN